MLTNYAVSQRYEANEQQPEELYRQTEKTIIGRRKELDNLATQARKLLKRYRQARPIPPGDPPPPDDESVPAVQALETHIDATSGARGLPASVIRAAPRLAGQASRLSDEHADLLDKHRQVTSMALDAGGAPDDLRDAVARHAALLLRHVRHAHDLLHDAIESELGGGD